MSATSLTFWFIILNCVTFWFIILNCVMQARPPRAFPLFMFVCFANLPKDNKTS